MESETIQIPLQPRNNQRSNNLSNSSIGVRLIRAARARQIYGRYVEMENSEPETTVELLSKIGDVVGLATREHTFQSGMELHGCRMFPSKVAVRIIQVDDASHWTGEVVGERLGACMGLIIRWNRSLLRIVGRTPNISNSQGQKDS